MFENNSSNEKLPVRSASLKKIHLESYRFILITLEEAVTEGLSRNNTFLFYWFHFDLLESVSVLEGWKMIFICFRFSHIWVRMFCYNYNGQVLNRKSWSYAVLISKLCSECSLGSSSRSKEEVDPIRMLSRGILISRSVQFSYFDCQVNKFISWLIAGLVKDAIGLTHRQAFRTDPQKEWSGWPTKKWRRCPLLTLLNSVNEQCRYFYWEYKKSTKGSFSFTFYWHTKESPHKR